jgi:hypothetical protein
VWCAQALVKGLFMKRNHRSNLVLFLLSRAHYDAFFEGMQIASGSELATQYQLSVLQEGELISRRSALKAANAFAKKYAVSKSNLTYFLSNERNKTKVYTFDFDFSRKKRSNVTAQSFDIDSKPQVFQRHFQNS